MYFVCIVPVAQKTANWLILLTLR